MTAFIIKLNCGNCGHTWDKRVDEGRKIFPRSFTRNRVKIADESITGGMETGPDAREVERVDCPVCDTHSKVNVEDRNPA